MVNFYRRLKVIKVLPSKLRRFFFCCGVFCGVTGGSSSDMSRLTGLVGTCWVSVKKLCVSFESLREFPLTGVLLKENSFWVTSGVRSNMSSVMFSFSSSGFFCGGTIVRETSAVVVALIELASLNWYKFRSDSFTLEETRFCGFTNQNLFEVPLFLNFGTVLA